MLFSHHTLHFTVQPVFPNTFNVSRRLSASPNRSQTPKEYNCCLSITMGFIAGTPESMLARSDSKDPATTCRGVTGGGKPCRRPNRVTPETAPKKRGKKAVIDLTDENLFCWQHKDQVSSSSDSTPASKPMLGNRTSLDTLADRLGILEVSQSQNNNGSGRPPSKMSRPRPRKELKFCCFTIPLEEEPEPQPRPRPQPVQKPSKPNTPPTSSRPNRPSQSAASSTPSAGSQTSQYLSVIPPTASPQTASLLMKELAKPLSEQDEAGYIYMFWLTPQSATTTAPTDVSRSLLSPPSPVRPSAGGSRRPSDVMASFVAAADSLNPADGRSRSANEIFTTFAAAAENVTGSRDINGGGGDTRDRHIGSHTGNNRNTVLLKIGRANNVQRRLNEWKRQCGFDVSLIRYYPYVSSSGSSSSVASNTVRKMPHSHKVETLVHIELSGLGLRVADKGKCESCGRTHKEWFEVDASREGVLQVDELIRRWSDWDEQYNS